MYRFFQGVEYERRMNAKADALAAANRAMVAANNAYIADPSNVKLAKAHTEACEAVIRAAEDAANEAKAAPPAPLKRSTASDFTIGGVVRSLFISFKNRLS